MAVVEAKPANVLGKTQVFETGEHRTRRLTVEESDPSSPPKQLFIVTPMEEGTYPVLLFLHGTSLRNTFYSHLLLHIASHGFIVIAPQLYTLVPPSGETEINAAADVTNWLPAGLTAVLPETVRPNLNTLALAGHSRGGKAAFSLALGLAHTDLPFTALIGVDPVAGTSKSWQIKPEILTYADESLDLGIPVAVLGTGLGSERRNWVVFLPCAPDGVSHAEFYRECQPPRAHFVAAEYGHMDMLDDNPPGIEGMVSGCICKEGKGEREGMRKGFGGIMVAFLRAFLGGESGDLRAIVEDPGLAPIKLDDVAFVEA